MRIKAEPLSKLDYKKIKDVFESALFMLDLLMFCNILVIVILTFTSHSTFGSFSQIHFAYEFMKLGISFDAFALIFAYFRTTLDFFIRKKKVGVGVVLLKYKVKDKPRILVWFDRLRFVPIDKKLYIEIKRKDKVYLEIGCTTSSLLYKIEKI